MINTNREKISTCLLAILIATIGYIVYSQWQSLSNEKDYQAVLQDNTIEAYDAFLSREDNESYRKDVEYYRDKKAFELAHETKDVSAYQEFLDKYPNSTWRDKVEYHRDEVTFKHAKESKSLDEVVTFLRNYPDSAWVPNFKYLLRHQFGYNDVSEVTEEAIQNDNYKVAARGGLKSQQPSVQKSIKPDRIISLDRYTVSSDSSNANVENKSWGRVLNPSGGMPESGFSAFYFNTKEPDGTVYTEPVDDIAINYSWDKLKGIKSEDFGGYWVGKINCEVDTTKQIFISQSHAKTRLFIDKEIIYEGGSDKEMSYQCRAGSHTIEVEHVNNWHTTEFSLRITEPVTYLLLSEVSNRLQDRGLQTADVGLVSIYESSVKDLSVKLELKKTTQPVVLFLTSYSPVVWEISNPFQVDLQAVIYKSHSPGARVIGDIGEETLVMATREKIGKYSSRPFPRCSCNGGHFHCEGAGIDSARDTIEQVTQRSLSGYTMAYSAYQLSYPERIIDQDFFLEAKKITEKNRTLEEECKSEKSPDFNAMFNG